MDKKVVCMHKHKMGYYSEIKRMKSVVQPTVVPPWTGWSPLKSVVQLKLI